MSEFLLGIIGGAAFVSMFSLIAVSKHLERIARALERHVSKPDA